MFNFVDKIKPLDTVWVVGDEFLDEHFYALRNMSPNDVFILANFGVSFLTSKKLGSSFDSAAARVRNSLAVKLRETVTPLPKMIFFLLEDDVIRDLFRPQESEVWIKYNRICNWLCNEVRKMAGRT